LLRRLDLFLTRRPVAPRTRLGRDLLLGIRRKPRRNNLVFFAMTKMNRTNAPN
jgi:hypothetical protein